MGTGLTVGLGIGVGAARRVRGTAVEHTGGHGHGQAQHRGHRTEQGRRGVTESGTDPESADPGTTRVGEVERGVVAGGGDGRRPGGLVHDEHLQRRGDTEPDGAQHDDGDHRAHRVLDGHGEQQEHHGQRCQCSVDGRAQPPVGERPRSERSERHPGPEQSQDDGHPGRGHPGDLGHHRGDVAEDREDPGETEDGGQQPEQHLGAAHRGDLPAQAHTLRGGHFGHEDHHAHQAHQGDGGDHEERGPPAHQLAEERPGGHTHDVGDGQTQEHACHGGGPARGAGHVRGDQGTDTEEGPVREPGQDPAGQDRLVSGREDGDEVADREEPHEQQQCGATGQPGGRCGQQRSAHDHTEGVGGDEVSSGGQGDAEIGGHLGQQPHDDELGRSDGEGPESQREQSEGHGRTSPGAGQGRCVRMRATGGGAAPEVPGGEHGFSTC